MTSPNQEREAVLKAASTAQITGDKALAQQTLSDINSYFLDFNIDDHNWEDFDPDLDGARQVLIEAFDL